MVQRVIISGGGTGGHIYPAIAIANALQVINPNITILFVGAIGKMEMEKVPMAGYEIIGLPIVGIKRSLSLENIKFPFKLIKSLSEADQIIRDFKPDVAVGVGGFASGPLLLMAALKGIPFLIQEQNSYAGLTNKVLSIKAQSICVAYPDMHQFFPHEKIKLLGNPVRNDILNISGKRNRALAFFGLESNRKTIFIMGGSLGAKSINEAIQSGLQQLTEAGYQIVWQTGKNFIKQAEIAIKALNTDQVKAFDFIYAMDLAYAACDVVVSRAGALSVSELCLVGKPALLIPFPAATEDHQTKNAMSLVRQNAAILVKDADAALHLLKELQLLLKDESAQEILVQNVKKMGKANAAVDIATEVLNMRR
jgi:UDP-N-acetylglucosamine--N-acetylmuramyl-(pentapeptide) pyrophosphoryl-undecaprenol N-acetylglucosamine transferase